VVVLRAPSWRPFFWPQGSKRCYGDISQHPTAALARNYCLTTLRRRLPDVAPETPYRALPAGLDDTIVSARNSINLAARIKADGGPIETKIFKQMSHIKMVAELATRPPIGNKAMPPVAAFIRSVTTTAVNDGGLVVVPAQRRSGSFR
jgi:hypothetical protein